MEKTEQETPRTAQEPYFISFLNRIGGVFLAPDSTFTQIVTQRISILEPLMLIILLVGIEAALIASFAYRIFSAFTTAFSSVTGTAPLGFLAFIPWIMLTMMIVSILISWLILAGIAHISAKYVFKGSGSYIGLLKLYGYAFIPYSLMILSTILIGISWVTWPIALFLNIIMTFWIIILMTAAVKQNYGVDTGKAFISSFIGPMLLWLIIVGIFWAWIWLITSSFMGGMM
ncbi:MAG TPA: Yip1 family protein [Candidatus Bathyarchaeia archaeon]